jgi:benzodiazapine receptor
MAQALSRPSSRGLWLNIAVFVGVVLVTNALIFATGSDVGGAEPSERDALLPPGPVVGAVWVAQFALLGLSRWLIVRDTAPGDWRRWLPVVLGLICLAFPLYTSGPDGERLGAIGTLVTLAVTVPAMLAIGRASSAAAWALVPLAAWLGYVACVYWLN